MKSYDYYKRLLDEPKMNVAPFYSFRRSLRCHDEHLKSAADAGMEMVSSTRSVSTEGGNSRGSLVRTLADEIRVFLFDQSTMEGDESKEPEERSQVLDL